MFNKRGSPLLHSLDRYLGIPAIALVGCIKRKRSLPGRIQTIGLLRTVAIGDTVLLSGVIADLRLAFPHASLVFFAGPSNFEIAGMLQHIDKVIQVPIGNVPAGLAAVRSVPVDVMIDFGQWPRLEALFSFLSRASFTLGFHTKGQHRHYGYDRTVDHSSRVHEIDNFRRLVSALGIKTGAVPSLPKPTNRIALPENYVVFHLWPGGRRKRLKQWPSDRWTRLIEEFASENLSIVLTGGRSDSTANEEVISRVRPSARKYVRNVAGASLQDSASILVTASLVVSVDTGVMHMAAALGAPLVALHGPSSSKRWGPIGSNVSVVESQMSGCGYIELGWESVSPVPQCMECIPYGAVREACLVVLRKQHSQQIDQSARVLVENE